MRTTFEIKNFLENAIFFWKNGQVLKSWQIWKTQLIFENFEQYFKFVNIVLNCEDMNILEKMWTMFEFRDVSNLWNFEQILKIVNFEISFFKRKNRKRNKKTEKEKKTQDKKTKKHKQKENGWGTF